MTSTYRIYLETDLNRVFTGALGSIAAAELDAVLTHRLGEPDTSIDQIEEGRTSYLRFEHDGNRSDLVATTATLSAAGAVFVEHSPVSLEPLVMGETLRFGTELVTTQRYKGKTNERLTRVLVNLALATDDSKAVDHRSLIDPMCGRGTTLNWALLYGVPATGLDVDRRALDEYARFLQQWAQGHRYPHRLQRYKKHDGQQRHFDFTVGADRASLEAKTAPDIRTFHASADDADVPVKRASMIVADLPYGIQHLARGDKDAPTTVGELVERVATHWPGWIRTGGSVALSWNTKSLDRADLVEVLGRSGFAEVTMGSFEHRVDRAVNRDIVVARRAAG